MESQYPCRQETLEGTEPYTVILVYGKDKDIGVIRAGSRRSGVKTVFRRKLDYEAVRGSICSLIYAVRSAGSRTSG